MGGCNSTEENVCQFYDIEMNDWAEFACLNERKQFASASIIKNQYIYVFGGYEYADKKDKIDTIEQYNI